MTVVPGIIGFIMGGNIVLAVGVQLLLARPFATEKRPFLKPLLWLFAVVIALAKGGFMGATISLWLLPTFIPAESPLMAKLPVFQTTFSLYQVITAFTGMVLVFILYPILRKVLLSQE